MAFPGPVVPIAPAGAPAVHGGDIPIEARVLTGLTGKRTFLDYGDFQVAYHTIGLASTAANPVATKPSRAQIRRYLAQLIQQTSQPAPVPGNGKSEADRRRRLDKALMAARTLRQFRLDHHDLRNGVDPLTNDEVNRLNHWHAVPQPLPFPAITAHMNNHQTNIQNLERLYRDARPLAVSPFSFGLRGHRAMQYFKPMYGRRNTSIPFVLSGCFLNNPLFRG